MLTGKVMMTDFTAFRSITLISSDNTPHILRSHTQNNDQVTEVVLMKIIICSLFHRNFLEKMLKAQGYSIQSRINELMEPCKNNAKNSPEPTWPRMTKVV